MAVVYSWSTTTTLSKIRSNVVHWGAWVAGFVMSRSYAVPWDWQAWEWTDLVYYLSVSVCIRKYLYSVALEPSSAFISQGRRFFVISAISGFPLSQNTPTKLSAVIIWLKFVCTLDMCPSQPILPLRIGREEQLKVYQKHHQRSMQST